MATDTITSSSQILHHITAFISETLAQRDLRHRLISALHQRTLPSNLKALNLATETLENAISTTNASVKSSSLRLAEKLLISQPQNPLSSFLLSLIYSLCNKTVDSALCILDIFYTDPSLARSDIVLKIFEELFLVHLIPVLEWFNEMRSKIMSSNYLVSNFLYGNDDAVSCEMSVVLPSSKLLSKMSGDQAVKIKELEGDYEKVIDENCKVLAKYFKDVLEEKDENRVTPPKLVFDIRTQKEEKARVELGTMSREDSIKSEEIHFENGRYNPIWIEGERSVEFCSSSLNHITVPKPPPSFPQRVSIDMLMRQNSSRKLAPPSNMNPDNDIDPSSSIDTEASSSCSDSEAEMKERNSGTAWSKPGQSKTQKQRDFIPAGPTSIPDRVMADSDNPPGGGKHTPPKDFVCPITSNLFDDPVTLETGQTYERRAIQEWLDRGNSTCPITRQMLHSTQLPKTNYVLKRLIASWQEQHPGFIPLPPEAENLVQEVGQKDSNTMVPATSPNSVISQARIDGTITELRHAITKLCMSEILEESEMAVLRIEQFWLEANVEVDIHSMLVKPPVINGFVEILFNSVDPKVLRATVFLLCELGSRDKSVIHTLTQVDSDVDGIVALFKKGLLEAVVLIYLLKPSSISLIEMDVMDTLLMVITKRDDDELMTMCLKPKTASLILLGQIVGSTEEMGFSSIINTILSPKVMESIIGSLEVESAEERISAVKILLRCMQEDGKCRSVIAAKSELTLVLESFIGASDVDRSEIVQFLSELVKLNRRTFNEQILHIIKDKGSFSMMHAFLNYLQTALQEQCALVAGLLLQLDLLEKPRKMSIYREEAVDALISCLRNSELPGTQIAAAKTIVSLQGRFSASGKPLIRAFLLKRAGLDKRYRTLMRMEQLGNSSPEIDETLQEEEKLADEWETKMAYVLASHEFGLLFEALAEGLKSRYAELCSACFHSAIWLVHMLGVLPDTGVRGAARVCLLKHIVSIFKSAKDVEDRVLAMLALSSFIQDPEGLRDMMPSMKDVLRGLRELKKYSPLAFEMLKVLSEGNESSADMWNHKELVQVDCSSNGEVLSITCYKDKIFSGHSDGTIKVWTGRGSILHLIQEAREHTKAVTSLAILHSGERLYSGSLDRTTKVWSIEGDSIHCIQVHDMKDQVHNLAVANSIACFIPQGTGVKVHSWNGNSKLLNSNKYVKCFSLEQGKLYCGCQDNSIQEIDLATGTISNIQSGSRKLLGKSYPVNAIQCCDGLIYSAGFSLDGPSVKMWNASTFDLVGSLSSTSGVRAIAVSSDLVYLGCKGGHVEIWCKEKHNRVETIQSCTNSKILCMALDEDEEVLVIGTSDGRIQAWGLS